MTEVKSRRRRWPWILVAALVIALAGAAVYGYRTYVPATPSVTAGEVAGLSPSDRAIMTESAALGQQASALGSKLGRSAMFGDETAAAQSAAQLKVIGQQLLQLAGRSQNQQLATGLTQAGNGAVLTATGVLDLNPGQTDQGLKMIKQSQDTLNAMS